MYYYSLTQLMIAPAVHEGGCSCAFFAAKQVCERTCSMTDAPAHVLAVLGQDCSRLLEIGTLSQCALLICLMANVCIHAGQQGQSRWRACCSLTDSRGKCAYTVSLSWVWQETCGCMEANSGKRVCGSHRFSQQMRMHLITFT